MEESGGQGDEAGIVEGDEDEENGEDDEIGREDEDLVELALLARLKGQDSEPENHDCGMELAVDHVMWALDAAKRGPGAMRKRPLALPWGAILRWVLGIAAAVAVVILLLMALNANFRELTLESVVNRGASVGGSSLLVGGLPAYRGEERLASTARALQNRSLGGCEGLAAQDLQRLRALMLVHRGKWRMLRMARVQRFSMSHLWLEAADGSGVRLLRGKATFREGKLGDEQELALGGEAFRSRGMVPPVALFDIVTSPS